MGILNIMNSVARWIEDSKSEDLKRYKDDAFQRGYSRGDTHLARTITKQDLEDILKRVGVPYTWLEIDRDKVIASFWDGYNKARSDREKKYKDSLESYGLTCNRCRGVAYPVEGTERHYKCKCGHRFTGVTHPF